MRALHLPGFSSNPYQRLLGSHLADHGVEVVVPESPTGVTLFGRWTVAPVLGAFFRRGRPEVVHLHWIHPFVAPRGRDDWLSVVLAVQFLLEVTLLKLLGVRVVWTVHNLVDHERRAPRVELAARHLLARLADAIVVHCDAVVDTVLRAYRLPPRYEEKIATVEHGSYVRTYADDLSREAARGSLGVDDDETVFLFFGQIRPYKNVPELLRTFAGVEGEQLRLFVVGAPNTAGLEREIRRLAARDDRVDVVLEYVPDEAIQRYMNAADAVVLPFEEVLTSGSTVLAMSFGRPVVVPELGCVEALTDHHPDQRRLAYDPETPDGLERALRTALGVDLDAVGAANRERAARLDWDRVAARTAALYRGTLPRSRSRSPVAIDAE